MSVEVDRDLHRSIEPAVRLLVAGLFALISLALLVFLIAGAPNAWLSPNPWLGLIACVSFLLAAVVFLRPVQGLATPHQSLRPDESEISARDYKVAEAIEFYDHVADIYDARLTREYLDTIRCAAAALLEEFADSGRKIEVLDVGAGTGQFVRLLEGTGRVEWTCIEPSNGMASRLRAFFDGPPVGVRVYEISLEDIPRFLPDRRFDAITLNSVLSSLEQLPDFSRFAGMLKEDGVLVISDGHPDIRTENRSFRIRALDGVHTLHIEHRGQAEVTLAAMRTGWFQLLGHEKTITKKGRLYSYVLCFRKMDWVQGPPAY